MIFLYLALTTDEQAKYFGNATPEDWKVYKFYTQTEDTVTVVRKEIVVSVNDLYETGEANNAVYSSKVKKRN